ncbi:HBS1-like protein isoform X1 [Cynara cardunculus var. scolymus]|uniref:HBS1-like protein isoform X1 n=1 Tax=Cynara cardunculus var. scolymus TaxID=59895 RepID=UPI000D631301|nr:HBS1-like protein isoform X1 [Cynara cardunculus var. scolymus]
MPRKVTYGVDFDDDYDIYDDYHDDNYNYDYGNGVDEHDSAWESPDTRQESVRQNVWRCPICTFDNEEYMSACDICGVLRNPLVRSSDNGQSSTDFFNAVGGICTNSGVSVMAKSLFASLPCRSPKGAVNFQPQKDASSAEEDKFSYLHGNNRGKFHDLHKAIISEKQYKVNIAPFKFDIPSPDDVVSMGMRSYKIGSKVAFDLKKPSTSDASSSKAKDNANLKSSAKSSNISAPLLSKDKFEYVDDDSHVPISKTQTHGLSSDLNSITMSAKSGNSKIRNQGKIALRSQYKPEKWMLLDQTEDQLSQLNLAIVGHVDSGKSTLSGRLLHLLGKISQKQMHKYEKEAKLQGKGSFAYAWAMDESAEERERGITMTVGVAFFNSSKYHVVVLDSPGHKDFVPNMISGATQADAAILVIDASLGAFEAGIDSARGQTREHAQLIRSFGVDQIIVSVNKMDAVEYSKERFETIKLQLGAFLRSCNFRDSSVSWIPLSAMENQNLVAPASDARLLSWYRGPSLLEAIDALQPPAREYSKPLLMPICDVIKLPSQGQVSAIGKLEAGALRNGSKVLILPSGEFGTVRSLERDSQACGIARAGDNVAVSLQGIDVNHVLSGGVLCHPDFPVAVTNHLELKLLVLDVQMPILIGSQLEFHIHHAKEVAKVAKIVSLLDSKTGKVTKKAPRCLLAKQSAIVEVVLQGEVCVDEFSNSRALGRAFLRSSGTTVAVGVVTRVIVD